MITLPAKFERYLKTVDSPKPIALIGIGESALENTQTSQSDWANNNSESQVDYTSSPGNVLLESIDVTDVEQTTTNSTDFTLVRATGPLPSITISASNAWQSFQGPGTSKEVTLETVEFYLTSNAYAGSASSRVSCRIFDGKQGTLISNLYYDNVANNESATKHTIDFTADNITINPSTTYWIELTAGPQTYLSNQVLIELDYNTAGGYANGQLDRIQTVDMFNDSNTDTAEDIGDAKFTVTFTGDYYQTSGSIQTQNIDLGETPTDEGEWQFSDLTPSDYGTTAITYTCYGSTDNFVASDVTIGAKVDGDTIGAGDYYRYYRVTAALSTTDQSETPTIQDIGLSFFTYKKYVNQKYLGYEENVHQISSLTTIIDDFEITTVGEMSVTLGFTESLSEYLANISVRNKPAYIKLGFVPLPGETFEQEEFINFYKGIINDYRITKDHKVNIKIRDPNQNWSAQVPVDTTSSEGKYGAGTFTNIVASADHPASVMLDIFQEQLNIRDAALNLGSFAAAETTLSGWEVTRTVSGTDRQGADQLLNELRILMSSYLITDSNGKITLRLFDSTDAAVDSLTDDDLIGGIDYDGNQKSLYNKTFIEFDESGGSYGAVWIGLDATSISNFEETKPYELEDLWTVDDVGGQGEDQIEALSTNILARYADPPSILTCEVDYKKLDWEVGNFISVTISNAPSTDFEGISAVKYQIVNKNIDPNTFRLKFKFLKV